MVTCYTLNPCIPSSSHPVFMSGGVLSCGKGDSGQLGLGRRSDEAAPVSVPVLENKRIVSVACGNNHSVVIDGEMQMIVVHTRNASVDTVVSFDNLSEN